MTTNNGSGPTRQDGLSEAQIQVLEGLLAPLVQEYHRIKRECLSVTRAFSAGAGAERGQLNLDFETGKVTQVMPSEKVPEMQGQ